MDDNNYSEVGLYAKNITTGDRIKLAVTYTINEMVAYASGYMTLWPGYLLSTASITYDAYQSGPDRFPEGAYIQVKTEKLGTLRLNLRDERKEV